MSPLFRGKGISRGSRICSAPNGSWCSQAGEGDPLKQCCLVSFFLKLFSMNRSLKGNIKKKKKCQLPTNFKSRSF